MTTKISETARGLLADTEARLQAARGDNPDSWNAILAEARVAESLVRVWTCSEFIATSCIRSPAVLTEL
ncbi:hypothetical protein, partial [Steroidobacter sp.]|uniref:hypothetical protein n=1 Tax=Steroidobacter sp. TaxID=1978227 RepID=UPI001A45CC10